MADSHHILWQQAVVDAVSDVAENIRRIVLRPERPCAIRPGEHVDVRTTIEGEQHVRSYSVVNAADDGTHLALSVFRTPTSRGGSVFMHSLQPGQRLEITQPLQNFPLRIGAPSYVLLAGGIGITAIAGMAALLRRLGADYRLVYVARSRDAMAYLDDLAAMHGDRFEAHIDAEGVPLDVRALVGSAPEDAEFYMCGPIRLMDAVRRAWTERELEPTNLRYETFGNSGWYEAEPFTVRIPRLGVETHVGSDESVLEALERDGVDMMSDCRKGECGLCQVKVLELAGRIDHRDVFYSDRQKEPNTKMCCCVSRVVAAEPGTVLTPRPTILTIDVP
ncbi:PDR/VanB family oxidoreductase [Arthrobacter sp. Rue61a]|uniref:Vanillate O-demethylase oxygenase subunit B n=1 Tax=Paenarthrobacter aurescens (strain TC1) TaxID=290340 RepID=A1R6Y4_PAEAT|nr:MULTISPECIES: PDR/VanB family oxidoreductase [Micrococcaceae]ABM08133.1 vanillate O-demethylase oxygenase subunit B [Paenarthrobacter aurescens TC1]AFR29311.1 vanB-like reductase component (flavin-iron/sulfur protein) of oxygenase system [Arthrobacter sp. Rue61a]